MRMQRLFQNRFYALYPFIFSYLSTFLYTSIDSANIEVNYKFKKSTNQSLDDLHDKKMFWIRLEDRIKGFLLIFIDLDQSIKATNTATTFHKFNISFTNNSFDDPGEKIFKSHLGTIRAYFIGKDPDAVDLDPLNQKLEDGTLSGILNELDVYDKLTSRTYFSRREYDLVLLYSIERNIWEAFVDKDNGHTIKYTASSDLINDENDGLTTQQESDFPSGFKIISYNKPNIISNNFKIILPGTMSAGTWTDLTNASGGVTTQKFKYEADYTITADAVYKFKHFGKDYNVKISDMKVIDQSDAEKIEEKIKEIMGVTE